MNLKSVEELNLTPAEGAAKGSLKLNGKAIEAHFTFEDLSIVWRAVLRDGSHYLRTEMDINSNKDVAMRGIIAMKYSFNNKFSKQLPHVVGNTRGAVIANDKIFAGLETPMGINTVASAPTVETSVLQGLWSRQATLQAGKTWNVGAVVGLIAKDQARRSFLAYSERERAVPWREIGRAHV